MPDYRRNRVPGGTFFFTANLLDRRSDLLVTQIDALREVVRGVRARAPSHFDAWVAGDYDVPLGLFTLLYVLTFWRSIEQDGQVHTSWFAISAAALVLAVMTKGVAGTFGLVGLFVFSLMRGRLITLRSNFHVWLLALLALFLCFGYYGSRELYDPGYLQAIWQNELGGRFFAVNEEHAAGPLFYIYVLIVSFEPGIILLPVATLTVLGADSRRRSIATLCLL